MKPQTERSLVQAGFWLAVAILCGVGVAAHHGTLRVLEHNERTGQSHRFTGALETLLACLDEAESHARGFVITGGESALMLFASARARTQEALVTLDAVAPQAAANRRQTDQLVMLVEKRLDLLEQLVTRRRNEGFASAQMYMESNRHGQLMDEIRTSIASVIATERAGSARETADVKNKAQLATALLVVGCFTSLAILLAVFLFLNVQIDAREIAERALAAEKRTVEQAYQRQEALAEIELAINQPHELQRVLDRIAEIITHLLPATGASVILYDEMNQEFIVSASTAPPVGHEPIQTRIRRTGGATRWIVDRKKPLVVTDIRDDPFGANSMLHESGLHAYAGVPLLVEGQAFGVLYALDQNPRDYRPPELDFLTALAARAALAISKVKLYSKLQDVNQLLEQRVGTRTAELAATNERLHELSGRLLQLQDEERRRFARELHDVTAQNLSAVTLNLARLQSHLPATDHQAADIIAESLALAEQCLREIRTLSYVLHPPMLDEYGLVRALEWYLDGFTKRSGVRVNLDAAPAIGRLATEAEMALFRVVQECLTNIHRHSGSGSASIQLTRTDSQVTLTIQDQGGGMNETGNQQLGVGITGMRERLRQLGGSLEVDSNHRGTTVCAIVPVPETTA